MSNLVGGALNYLNLNYLDVQEAHDIFDADNLLKFFGRGKSGIHIVAGSASSTRPRWASAFENVGFKTKIYLRDKNIRQEKVVDEFLCNQALKAALNCSPKETFIFVTGDGNGSNDFGSFFDTIHNLLGKKLYVEIWSFKTNLNKKYSEELKRDFPALISVNFLDGHAQYNSATRQLKFETGSAVTTPASVQKKESPCLFFANNKCMNGDNCKFQHIESPLAEATAEAESEMLAALLNYLAKAPDRRICAVPTVDEWNVVAFYKAHPFIPKGLFKMKAFCSKQKELSWETFDNKTDWICLADQTSGNIMEAKVLFRDSLNFL